MNKQGALIMEIGMWIVRIFLVVIIIVSVALQSRTYVNARVNLDVAEPTLLIQLLGTSPVFLYSDSTGTLHRAVSVDRFKKASSADVLAGLDFGRRYFAARIVLKERDGKEIKTLVLNDDYYNELMSEFGQWAGKTVVKQQREWPVRLIENDVERSGIIFVEVLLSR